MVNKVFVDIWLISSYWLSFSICYIFDSIDYIVYILDKAYFAFSTSYFIMWNFGVSKLLISKSMIVLVKQVKIGTENIKYNTYN